MYCLKIVNKKCLCFRLPKYHCIRNEYFISSTRKKEHILENIKKQLTNYSVSLTDKNIANKSNNSNLLRKPSQLDYKLYHAALNKILHSPAVNSVNGINFTHPLWELQKAPFEKIGFHISNISLCETIGFNYLSIQKRYLHVLNIDYVRNVKSIRELEAKGIKENDRHESDNTQNLEINSRRKSILKKKIDKLSNDIAVNNEDEIHPKLRTHPKNILHNFFAILSQELKSNFRISPNYLLQGKQWHCTYYLKWPEPVKISKHAVTKKEASHKAAIAALTWLEQHNKINSNGQPLIYDKTDSKIIIEKNRKILQLDDFILSQLKLIYEKYSNNFMKNMTLNDDAEGIENTDLLTLDQWPLKNIKQNILPLNNYAAIEDIKLPIQEYRTDIIDLINQNRIIIIKGEPGCGKSIRVPQYVLESWSKNGALEGKPCKIIVTQPRRIAALSLAERVSFERQEQVGNIVGYQVRFKTNFNNRKGRILYCTTGILLRRLQTNSTLSDCTHIILDEAHERDVNIDLLMNLLQYALKLNPELKLIVMSATIDTNVFQEYFKNASVFHVPGFTYPVKEHFIDDCKTVNYEKTLKTCESNQPHVITEDVVSTIRYIHSTKPEGAILCFLPGWEDITKVAKALPSTSDMLVLYLHSKLNISDQKKVFGSPPPGVRKVILSTNIAETSITINDIVYVIDTGIEKQSRFDAEKGVMCVDENWVSQANVKQRKGRAGRVQPGESFHLYTKKRMADFRTYPIPEILRTSLVKIVLDSKVYSGNMNAVEFLSHLPTPPNEKAIVQAVNELVNLDLLDKNENLTPLGRTLSNFQMEPKLARTIANAVIFQCVTPIINIVSLFAEENNIFESSLVNKEDIKEVKSEFSDTSDHLAMMKIFKKWLEYIEEDSGMANEFCSETSLVNFKLNTVQKLQQVYFDYVFKCFNREVSIRDDFSGNDELVKAVLLSNGGSLLKLSNFEKVKGRLKKKNVLLNRNNHIVKITPESVNYNRTRFPSDFLMYINETRSNIRRTSSVRETSFISLLSLLLFKNENLNLKELQASEYESELQSNDQVLLVLEKSKIQCICDRSYGEAIVKCKEALHAGISYYNYLLATQNCTNDAIDRQWKEILTILNSVLVSSKI